MADINVTINPAPSVSAQVSAAPEVDVRIGEGIPKHAITHAPGGSDSLEAYYATTGSLAYISGLTTGIGNTGYLTGYVSKSETGDFYPSSNPSGFITGVDLSSYATQNYVTGVSGYLQNQVTNLANNTGNYVTGSVVRPNQTGAFLTTGAADARYVLQSVTGVFATQAYVTGVSGHLQTQITAINNQTGNFALKSQTGSFVTTGQTGQFITQSVANARYVSLTGNQNISGDKTFVNKLIAKTGFFGTSNIYGNFVDQAIAGGNSNEVSGDYSFIGGGQLNKTSGEYSIIAGGLSNTGFSRYSFIGAGYFNFHSGGNQYSNSFIGAGANNTTAGSFCAIVGGANNKAFNNYSAALGGLNNNSANSYSSIVGGLNNTASGNYSFIGGGYQNSISTVYSTIGGGFENIISFQNYSTIAGGRNNIISGSSDSSFIGGGQLNKTFRGLSFVGGGYGNIASGASSNIAGGFNNVTKEFYSNVAGGAYNIAINTASAVGGGFSNEAHAIYSNVGGGAYNIASGAYSNIAGGSSNNAKANSANIGGGQNNNVTSSGVASSIVGGIGAKTDRYGMEARASYYFDSYGDAQKIAFTLYADSYFSPNFSPAGDGSNLNIFAKENVGSSAALVTCQILGQDSSGSITQIMRKLIIKVAGGIQSIEHIESIGTDTTNAGTIDISIVDGIFRLSVSSSLYRSRWIAHIYGVEIVTPTAYP